MFELNVRPSRSGDLVVLLSESRSTSEAWVVDAHLPESAPRSVGGRRHGIRYRAEHAVSDDGERLLVVTNDGAVEFRLMTAPVPRSADQDASTWREVRPEHPDERLLRADAFAGGVVLSFRAGGEHRLRIVPARRPVRATGSCCAAGTTSAASIWPATRRTTPRR